MSDNDAEHGSKTLLATTQNCVVGMQAGPRQTASLPQNLKASMLTARPETDQPRKVVIAYDGFDVGRQMLTWAAKYCLASEDELHLLQYQAS